MAAAVSYTIIVPVTCSSNSSNKNNDPHKLNLNKIKINGTTSRAIKAETLSHTVGVATTSLANSTTENGCLKKECTRQNIPTKKHYVDQHRQGLIIEEGVGYRQTVVIRSNEVGPDKTARRASSIFFRGEVVEIDTWVGASGKNRVRRDWLIRSQQGHVFARATSTWVMMNEKTRRLSKMPEEVRAEISPWFIVKQAIKEDVSENISKLDDKAKYVNSDLKPKRSDLDMNHHVNNVKYVRWMLETIPYKFLESHQLSGIILEYRRECGSSDTVQSLCQPGQDFIPNGRPNQINELNLLNGFSLASEIMQGNGLLVPPDKMPKTCTHLIQITADTQNEEIVRGKTIWSKKMPNIPFSA